MLNIEIDSVYEQQIRKLMKSGKNRSKKGVNKEQDNYNNLDPDSNEQFFYIAGYTSNGVPFGITWEEAGEKPPWIEDE